MCALTAGSLELFVCLLATERLLASLVSEVPGTGSLVIRLWANWVAAL